MNAAETRMPGTNVRRVSVAVHYAANVMLGSHSYVQRPAAGSLSAG